MKLKQDEDNFVLSNVSNSSEFGIVHNAKMFSILSSGVYEHKIAAIIRELCCNAYDSHVDAGTPNLPFNVTLPNDLHPYFEVEDFGVGLDDEEVRNIFTVYGSSTKQNSNDVIGALGLGSKTPFAYTSTFNIRTRKDGIERHYNAYIGDNGNPNISLIGEAKTDEHNGVKISVPINRNDARQFIDEAQAVLSFFKTKPNCNRELEYMFDDVWEQLDEKGYANCKRRGFVRSPLYSNPKLFAMMGNVAYPFHFNNISENIDDTFLRDYIARQLRNSDAIIIQFNIGDLDISASRESLSLDEDTLDTLTPRVTELFTKEFEKYKKEVETKPTELDAIEFITDKIGSFALSFFEWKNRPLNQWQNTNYDLSGFTFGNTVTPGYNFIFQSTKRNVPRFDRDDLKRKRIIERRPEGTGPRKMKVVHVSDNKRTGIKKYTKMLAERSGCAVFVVESRMTPLRKRVFEERMKGVEVEWYLLSELRKKLMERNYVSQKKEQSEVQGVFFQYKEPQHSHIMGYSFIELGSSIEDLDSAETYYIERYETHSKDLVSDGMHFKDATQFCEVMQYTLSHALKRQEPLNVVVKNKGNEARLQKFGIKPVSELITQSVKEVDDAVSTASAVKALRRQFSKDLKEGSVPFNASQESRIRSMMASAGVGNLMKYKRELQSMVDYRLIQEIDTIPSWYMNAARVGKSGRINELNELIDSEYKHYIKKFPMLGHTDSNALRYNHRNLDVIYKNFREYIELIVSTWK